MTNETNLLKEIKELLDHQNILIDGSLDMSLDMIQSELSGINSKLGELVRIFTKLKKDYT